MGKGCHWIIAAALALASITANAGAETTRAGASVKIDGASGSVFAAGASVEITGEVDSGLSPWTGVSAAGGSVNVSASVDGALFLAGGDVNFSGRSKVLFAAGGNVTVSGVVDDEANVAGGNIAIVPKAIFNDDVNIAGASIDFAGAARGDADIAGAFVRLNGAVDGDAELAGEEVVIGPDTHVKGDLTITAPKAVDIPAEAQIDGEVIYKESGAREIEMKRWERHPFTSRGGIEQSAYGALFWFVALGASGAVMMLVFPHWFGEAAVAGRDKALTTFLIGVAVLITLPISAILLIVTILGLPFGGFLFALYFGLLSISMIGAGLASGHLLFDRSKEPRAKVSLYLLGLAIVLVLGAVPLLGVIVTSLAFPFGLGVLSRGLWVSLRGAPA